MIYCKQTPYQVVKIPCVMPINYFDSNKVGAQEWIIETILSTVSKACGVTVKAIKSKTRERDVVQAKAIGIYLILHHMPKLTLDFVGSIFSNLNHATVIYNRDKVAGYLKVKDRLFTQNFNYINSKVISTLKNNGFNKVVLNNIRKVA